MLLTCAVCCVVLSCLRPLPHAVSSRTARASRQLRRDVEVPGVGRVQPEGEP